MRGLAFVLITALAAGACASSGAVPRPFPTRGTPRPTVSTAEPPPPADSTGSTAGPATAAASGYSISSTALSLRGAPYRNGGADPDGFDCSGFVKYVFEQFGISLPRDVRRQFDVGAAVDGSTLEPGDLVFFTTVTPGASHVGIAVGGDQFVHAPSSSGVVRVERLTTQYWSSRFVGAKRVN